MVMPAQVRRHVRQLRRQVASVVEPAADLTIDLTPGATSRNPGVPHQGEPVDPVAAARERLEHYHEAFPPRHERIGDHIEKMMDGAGVTGGRMLEIGGRDRPFDRRFGAFDYVGLDLEETGPGVVIGDITDCPQLESGSFDAVISVDVLQNVRRPWLAAQEIVRLLKPGGFTYHSTVFSWRRHPSPVDYWRFSPDALMFLFADLRVMRSDLDPLERRRNLIGRGRGRIDPDAWGGWRENWRVFYAGVAHDDRSAAPVPIGTAASAGTAAAAGTAVRTGAGSPGRVDG